MRSILRILCFTGLLLLCRNSFAQESRILSGRVVNEKGQGVEYVSIGIPKDTVYTVSDTAGYFSIRIPEGKDKAILFKHVSYELFELKPEFYYSANGNMTVTLINSALPEAIVTPRKEKAVTILGKGVRWAGCSFGLSNSLGSLKDQEWGSMVTIKKTTRVDKAEIEATLRDAEKAVLSFVVYRIDGRKEDFINVQHTPVYQSITVEEGCKNLIFEEPETIILDPGRYYFAIRFVEFDGRGSLDCKGYFKSAYDRNDNLTVPISLGLKVYGTEYDR